MPDNIFYEIRKNFIEKNNRLLHKNVASLICYLKESEYILDKIFFHPLGFIYSPLFTFDNKESIRLHIWDKENRHYQEPRMDIHNHYYTVNSYVLSGRIINNIFYKVDHKPSNYTIYTGSYNENGERCLESTRETIYVEKVKEEIINPNSIYNITPEVLHSSHVDLNDFTCTIVYTENPGQPSTKVLGPLFGEFQYTYNHKIVNRDLVEDLLEKLVRVF
ncbi:MAG: hypothetical protein ACXWEY_05035 [Bacteroidia bacterium]